MNTTRIWDLYQKGTDHHRKAGMYDDAELCHNFYIGNQWVNPSPPKGAGNLPVFNFIKPVIKYKVSMIAQNLMTINYSSVTNQRVCDALNAYALNLWEKTKMDTVSWAMLKNGAIAGDHYLYCFEAGERSESVVQDTNPVFKTRLIDKTNVYFADEQNPNINEQEWIILSERLPVSRVRKEAEKYNLSEEDIRSIISDDETQDSINQDKQHEVESEDGKCTSLLFLTLTDEGLKFCRSVKGVIYQPEETIPMKRYPLVSFIWEEQKGDSRGVSAVKQMISNQREVNATAARRAVSIQRFSFPIAVTVRDRLNNPDALNTPGATIEIKDGGANDVKKFIDYLVPPPISADAANLQNEFISRTQELEGAGDAALGNVNPEQASGEAIRAARDQAAIPLNEQVAGYKQFVEDVALLWYDMIVAYAPFGISTVVDGEEVNITADELKAITPDVRIDISPVDPYSKLSQEVTLTNLLTQQIITFDEYVEALDDDSAIPKSKLKNIIAKRQEEMNAGLMQGMQDGTQGSIGQALGGADGLYTDMPLEAMQGVQQTY